MKAHTHKLLDRAALNKKQVKLMMPEADFFYKKIILK